MNKIHLDNSYINRKDLKERKEKDMNRLDKIEWMCNESSLKYQRTFIEESMKSHWNINESSLSNQRNFDE